MHRSDLKEFLDEKAALYERRAFVDSDPISIPHLFSRKEDIEISAFLAASIAWGKRASIISNGKRLVQMMDFAPYDFLMGAEDSDYRVFDTFVHRTFSSETTISFLKALRHLYVHHNGLEHVFTYGYQQSQSLDGALAYFRRSFMEGVNDPSVVSRHLPDVTKNSACKRLNMFLRWMVRGHEHGVDFGLWKSIPTSALMMPLDVHSGSVARKLGLLSRKQDDWKAVVELTANLCEFDCKDPVKYDFALFGLGVFEKF